MAINIERANIGDVDEMVRVGMKAFANNDLQKAGFDVEKATQKDVDEYTRWRIDRARSRMSGPGRYYFVAKDEETGAIVGYAGVNSPEVETVSPSSIPQPNFVNTDGDDEFEKKQKLTREDCLGDRKDVWYVQSMLVLPGYQGRGIAKRLLNRAMEEADRAGQDVYLEGTAEGLALYVRCGFESLQDISMMNGTYVMKAMIRHPKKVVDE